MWKELAKVIPELSHYIGWPWDCENHGVRREGPAESYICSDQSLCAVINPSIKLKWIEEYWLSNELADAERWMEEVVDIFICLESILLIDNSPAQMLAHCRARRLANVASQPAASRTDVPIARNGAPAAVVAQARGFANFTKLSVVRRVVSSPSTTKSSSNTPAPSTPTTPSLGSGTLTPILSNLITLPSSTVSLSSVTEEEKAAQEAEDQARDLCTVRNELRRYKEEPPPDDVPLDLVRYWTVSFVHAALNIVLN
jgi:hypothetical protein